MAALLALRWPCDLERSEFYIRKLPIHRMHAAICYIYSKKSVQGAPDTRSVQAFLPPVGSQTLQSAPRRPHFRTRRLHDQPKSPKNLSRRFNTLQAARFRPSRPPFLDRFLCIFGIRCGMAYMYENTKNRRLFRCFLRFRLFPNQQKIHTL